MKSKQQKQQEAIERKRKFLPTYIRVWTETTGQVTAGIRAAAINGDQRAQFAIKQAEQSENALIRAAAEAKCDRHGNPEPLAIIGWHEEGHKPILSYK